jgi:hypothetical protein
MSIVQGDPPVLILKAFSLSIFCCLTSGVWRDPATFPITLRADENTDGRRSGTVDTYIVCLSCGTPPAVRLVRHARRPLGLQGVVPIAEHS